MTQRSPTAIVFDDIPEVFSPEILPSISNLLGILVGLLTKTNARDLALVASDAPLAVKVRLRHVLHHMWGCESQRTRQRIK